MKIESGNGSQIITVIAQEETAELSALLANTFVATFKEEIKTLMNLDNLTILQEVASKTDTKKLSRFRYFILRYLSRLVWWCVLQSYWCKKFTFPISTRKVKWKVH